MLEAMSRTTLEAMSTRMAYVGASSSAERQAVPRTTRPEPDTTPTTPRRTTPPGQEAPALSHLLRTVSDVNPRTVRTVGPAVVVGALVLPHCRDADCVAMANHTQTASPFPSDVTLSSTGGTLTVVPGSFGSSTAPSSITA
jgi:hypothetical protein